MSFLIFLPIPNLQGLTIFCFNNFRGPLDIAKICDYNLTTLFPMVKYSRLNS